MSETEPKRFGLPLRYLTLIALIVSPAAGTGFAMLCMAFFASLLKYQPFENFAGGIINGAFYGGAMGAIPALIVGLPAHAALLKNRITGLGPYVGVFVGLALVVLLVTTTFPGMGSMFATLPIAFVLFAFMYSFAGAASGVAFWLIRRPDRDAATSRPPA